MSLCNVIIEKFNNNFAYCSNIRTIHKTWYVKITISKRGIPKDFLFVYRYREMGLRLRYVDS